MRLIDAEKLKKHYAWWEGKMEVTKEGIDTIVDLQPTVEAVPTDFHDKCQQIEIQKRLKLEEAYRSMERTVEKLTKALAETEPVRHAHWVKDRLLSINGWTYGVHICPLCGMSYQDIGYGFNYCPNCGAKMDEVTE